MKTQVKQPQPVSHTIQGKTRAANQASVQRVLQKYATTQRAELPEDELLQGKFDTTQREEMPEEDELLQGKFETTQREETLLPGTSNGGRNQTGMLDNLKSGIENLSGYNMDAVRVHYNSPKPAQLQALAYTQGTDIHVAPGQEQHLPHEAWHVVQQMQGRVQPTMQMQGVDINDNEGLEKEADVMGGEAVQMKSVPIQLAETNEKLKEVSLDELPEDKARKHLSDSFKKGDMKAPLVNQSGQIVQRVPKKQNWEGGELFCVLKSDLDTGTGTSQSTRKYVNDSSTPKPNSVLFDYSSSNSTSKAKTSIFENLLAYEVDNSEADRSYRSGNYWDAGHKLARQNGGLGNDAAWVFPQNPALNQGNHKNMDDDSEETHPKWREHEDCFYTGVKTDGGGVWWVKFT